MTRLLLGEQEMFKAKRIIKTSGFIAAVFGMGATLMSLLPAPTSLAAQAPAPVQAPAPIKVPDPTKVVMIVNRDSNDVAFMDVNTKKVVGSTFLGNNVNP